MAYYGNFIGSFTGSPRASAGCGEHMNPHEKALRETYKAFYEHSYKSEAMFEILERIADTVFRDTTNISEETWIKLCDKTWHIFHNHARSVEEKKAVDSLMLLSIL